MGATGSQVPATVLILARAPSMVRYTGTPETIPVFTPHPLLRTSRGMANAFWRGFYIGYTRAGFVKILPWVS